MSKSFLSDINVEGTITATGGNSTNWNSAFEWGNHATQGYLTSFTETDPVFTASQAFNIDANDITNLSNLSGVNTGDQTSIVGITGTKSQFDTAVTDGNFLYVSDNISSLTNDENYIVSDVTGATGADIITNIVSLTQSEYDAITPNASTVYKITDATGGGGSSTALNGITDVTITSVSDNEILAYDTTSAEWINQTAAEAGLATSAQGSLADSAVQPGDNISGLTNDEDYIQSDPTGVTGADTVTNIITLTQAEYDAITPNSTTIYIIT